MTSEGGKQLVEQNMLTENTHQHLAVQQARDEFADVGTISAQNLEDDIGMHLKDIDDKTGIILNVDEDMLDNDHEVAVVNHADVEQACLTATEYDHNKETPAAGNGDNKQVSRKGTSMTLSALAQAELKDKTPQRSRKKNDKSGMTTVTSVASAKADATPGALPSGLKEKTPIGNATTSRKIRSLFKETISTKVKRQEKYQNAGETSWNRAAGGHALPGGGSSYRPSKMTYMNTKHGTLNHESSHQVSTRMLGLPTTHNHARSYKQKLTGRSHRGDHGDDDTVSDNDAQNAANEKNIARQKRLAELNRFKMKKEESDEDGGFKVRTRLMIKLQKMGHKAEDVHSDDQMDNSYDQSCSDISYDDEDDMNEEERKARIKKRKAKKLKKKKLVNQPRRFVGLQQQIRRRPGRRPIANVFCTDYDVVKKAARNCCGFRLKEYKEDCDGAIVKGQGGQKLSEEWDLTWHNTGITPDFFSKLQPYQKVNQFPGIQVITRKNTMARNLCKLKKLYAEKFKFFPRTWILPMEASEFHNQFIDKMGRPLARNRQKTYIVKPDNLAQGKGIYLARSYDKIVENCIEQGGGWVVQEYLANPHLIEDLKYDLRIYVLLCGLNPLRIYIHEEGLARFATEPYEKPRNGNLDNMYVHLTNYSINKNNTKFKQSNKKAKKSDYYDYGDYGDYDDEYDDEDEETGHKRSLWAILKIILQQGGDPDAVMDEIKDMVVKTIITGQPYMNYMYKICQPEDTTNAMAFQILGFDVMIDKHFRPWLIEVNQSPSFATDSPLDYQVKKAVLTDTFNLLQLSQAKRDKIVRDRNEQNAERIMTGKVVKITQAERDKIRAEAHEDRVDHERLIINAGSGFELIYPYNWDDDKQVEYEMLLRESQRLWDDFTTGKKQKAKQPHEDPKQGPAKKEKKEKEEVEEPEEKKSSSSSSDEEEKPVQKSGEQLVKESQDEETVKKVEQKKETMPEKTVLQHHSLSAISEQASPQLRTHSPLESPVREQSNVWTTEQRPASNPQGSPSLPPEHVRRHSLDNGSLTQLAAKLQAQLPEAYKLKEQVQTLQSQQQNLLTQSGMVSQDRDVTAAQKQYLEDIVYRQEQKIKYYQRIIEQQRILEGKIEQSASAINAAAYKSNTGFMASAGAVTHDYGSPSGIGMDQTKRHGGLGGGGPPPSFMQRAAHLRGFSDQVRGVHDDRFAASFGVRDKMKENMARVLHNETKSERLYTNVNSRQSQHDDRLAGQVIESSTNPNVNNSTMRDAAPGSLYTQPSYVSKPQQAQSSALLKAMKGEELTQEERYRVYEQKLLHSQLLASKKAIVGGGKGTAQTEPTSKHDPDLEQPNQDSHSLLIMRMEPQAKQPLLRGAPSKTQLDVHQSARLTKMPLGDLQSEAPDASPLVPTVSSVAGVTSQRFSGNTMQTTSSGYQPHFASQKRAGLPLANLRKPFNSPVKRAGVLADSTTSASNMQGSLVMSGQSILNTGVGTTGKKRTHVEQFMEYRNLVVQQQEAQSRAGQASRNTRATSSQQAVKEHNGVTHEQGAWQSVQVASGIQKKMSSAQIGSPQLQQTKLPLMMNEFGAQGTVPATVKVHPQKQFVLNLSKAPQPVAAAPHQQVFKLERRSSKGMIPINISPDKRKQLPSAATNSINGSPLKAAALMSHINVRAQPNMAQYQPVLYDPNSQMDSHVSLREDTKSPPDGQTRYIPPVLSQDRPSMRPLGAPVHGATIFKLDSKADGESLLHTQTSPKLGIDSILASRQGGIIGGHSGGMQSLESKRMSNVGISKYFAGSGPPSVTKNQAKGFARVAEQTLFGLADQQVTTPASGLHSFASHKNSVQRGQSERRFTEQDGGAGDRRLSVKNLNATLHIGPR